MISVILCVILRWKTHCFDFRLHYYVLWGLSRIFFQWEGCEALDFGSGWTRQNKWLKCCRKPFQVQFSPHWQVPCKTRQFIWYICELKLDNSACVKVFPVKSTITLPSWSNFDLCRHFLLHMYDGKMTDMTKEITQDRCSFRAGTILYFFCSVI